METLTTHRNNFDFLRFLFASLVIISHSYFLFYGDLDKDPVYRLTGCTLSTFAVNGFFVLSGFLIQQSRERSSGPRSFFRKRIIRITPGLWAAILFSVFIVGILFTELPTGLYFRDTGTWKYLVANFFLIPYQSLPGLFEHNHITAVNGSLWTLRYEVLFYLFLGAFFFFPKRMHKTVLLIALLLSVAGIYMRIYLPFYIYNGFNLGFYFTSGALLAGYKNDIVAHKAKLLLLSAIIFAIAFIGFQNRFYLITDASFVIMTLSFGLHYFPALHFSKYTGDISYGTYIYAYPVQQAILVWLQPKDVLSFLLYALVIVWPLGFLSWRLIEHPFIKMKSRKTLR